MGNSIFQINPFDKRLNVKLEGSISEKDGQDFFKKYSKEISLMSSVDFKIEIDCTDLTVNTFSQMLFLEKIYFTFKADGFNQILFIFKQDSDINNSFFVSFAKKCNLLKDQLKAV